MKRIIPKISPFSIWVFTTIVILILSKVADVYLFTKVRVGDESYTRFSSYLFRDINKTKLEKLSLEEKVFWAEDLYLNDVKLIPEYAEFKKNGIINLKKRRSVEATDFVIRDIISRSGNIIPGSLLREPILTTYPKGWLSGVTVSQTTDTMPRNVWARCYGRENGLIEIIFSATASQYTIGTNIHDCLSHELAHANDWSKSCNLLFEERIDLLLRVSQRLQDPDRYMSSYAESFSPTYSFRESNTKAGEYFAEICRLYFTAELDSLNSREISLIKWVIGKTDPAFDPISAYKERKAKLGE